MDPYIRCEGKQVPFAGMPHAVDHLDVDTAAGDDAPNPLDLSLVGQLKWTEFPCRVDVERDRVPSAFQIDLL